MRYYYFALLTACLLMACQSPWPPSIAIALNEIPTEIDFNDHVRPILSDRCFACHGPDEQSREAQLRLDTESGLRQLPESGTALFVAGDAEQSSLIHHILSNDPLELMPPPESKLNLSAAEKAILIRWVEQGAKWSRHWAFRPPRKYLLPSKWQYPGGAIDFFVRQSLEQTPLSPSPEADRAAHLGESPLLPLGLAVIR
ncbi:MAG: c-type cytochrome domain-containing protein [Bacteroidota bacterium]